jgi:hypothetical protein
MAAADCARTYRIHESNISRLFTAAMAGDYTKNCPTASKDWDSKVERLSGLNPALPLLHSLDLPGLFTQV